jgi:hypothetical protein
MIPPALWSPGILLMNIISLLPSLFHDLRELSSKTPTSPRSHDLLLTRPKIKRYAVRQKQRSGMFCAPPFLLPWHSPAPQDEDSLETQHHPTHHRTLLPAPTCVVSLVEKCKRDKTRCVPSTYLSIPFHGSKLNIWIIIIFSPSREENSWVVVVHMLSWFLVCIV